MSSEHLGVGLNVRFVERDVDPCWCGAPQFVDRVNNNKIYACGWVKYVIRMYKYKWDIGVRESANCRGKVDGLGERVVLGGRNLGCSAL